MNMLTEFFGHPLVHALGWTLLHFFWQGAAVAGLLWCVMALLSGRSSQSRYATSCIALLLMVVSPLITFAHIAANDYRMRAEFSGVAVPIDLSLIVQAGAGEPSAPWPTRMLGALDHLLPGLMALWFVGVIFFVVRLNFGLLVARRLKATGTDTPPDDMLHAFEILRIRLGIQRAVRLLHSARVQVPTVIGWLRPVVLVPASCLTGLSTEQIEAIFCHELAHVRRHDYLVSVFQSVAEALLFYHPAVWWVSKQVRRERECCCDDVAVAHGGDVLAYAKALSYLEERRAAFPEFVLGANGGVLTMRIKRLLGCKENTAASQFAAFTVLAVVFAMAGSYVVTSARAEAAAKNANAVISTLVGSGGQETSGNTGTLDAKRRTVAQAAAPGTYSAATVGSEYSNWLNQDVAWIITDQERATFLGLTNDQQRDQFIENFWERRNPTPGSAENAFRGEHYTRIAYANQHFARGDRPGWSTDRGHVYIAYGRPSEIETHPSGGAGSPYPYEVWHYQQVGGVGDNVDMRFVDSCNCGDYHYTISRLEPDLLSRTSRVAARVSYSPQNAAASPNMTQGESSIAGTVVDPTGAVVPRALVRVIDAQKSLSMVERTDASGKFLLAPLPSGSYTVEVVVPGFQAAKQENVRVDAGQRVGLNLKLQVGVVDERLTVTGTPAPAPPPPSFAAAPGKTDGPVRISAGVAAGMAISRPQPVYPQEAKAAHVQGVVVLHAIISKTGDVENLQVISGDPMLLTSSIDAVRQWKYKPYLLNGEPTAVETTININYTFGDSVAPSGQADGNADTTPTRAVSMSWKTVTPNNASDISGVAVRKVGGGVSVPIVIYQVDPEFTAEAKQAKFNGTVLLNFVVDEHGVPQNVHVVRGAGFGLDAKAMDAVKQSRFRPAMENGKPVPFELNIEVNFRYIPDSTTGASALLHAPLRTTTPVLIASLSPLQDPFSGMILAGRAATLRSIQRLQAGSVAQQGAVTSDQAESRYKLSDEQRARIEAQIDAAKREAGEATKRMNLPEFRKQLEDAQRLNAEAKNRMDSPEFRKQIEDAQRHARDAVKRLNTPEFRKQTDDAQNQAMAAVKQLNSADLKKLLDDQKLQMNRYRKDFDTTKFQKDMEEVRRQVDAAAEELREAGELSNPPDKK